MIAALLLATPPAHQRPRNRQHLYALRGHRALAADLAEAFLGDSDDLVAPVTTQAEVWCEAIRTAYASPPGPVDLPHEEARRLLEVSDLCWRVLQQSRKLKACPSPKRREARAVTAERERWALALRATLIELRVML